jgi:hypothetical protein
MLEATLQGESGKLIVRAHDYVRANVSSGLDANLLAGELELYVGSRGSFRAAKPLTLHTEDLRRFRDALQRLDAEMTGEATFSNIDSDFEATFRLTRGRGTLSGLVREWGVELRFQEIETDQTFTRAVLHDIEQIVARFPVRGSPFD